MADASGSRLPALAPISGQVRGRVDWDLLANFGCNRGPRVLYCALGMANFTANELARCIGEPVLKIVHSRPLVKASSFVIWALRIELRSGKIADLVAKGLARREMFHEVASVKPRFVVDPTREAGVYLDLLSPVQDELGTARFWGVSDDLLFIERVQGAELYECGIEAWKAAAQWLRGFHERWGLLDGSEQVRERLLSFDAAWFRRWAERATRFLGRSGRRSEEIRAFERARDAFLEQVEEIEGYPQGLVHGEFYASNVLAEETEAGIRIVPVDWEMAGVGPQWLDLAALTSGSWEPHEVAEIEDAYGLADADRPKVAFLRRALALQWLGWSPDWKPPKGHQQDWLKVFLSTR